MYANSCQFTCQSKYQTIPNFFPLKKKKKKNHLLVHDFFGKNSFYDENFFPFFFFFCYIYIVQGRNPRSKDSSYENIPRRQLGLIVHQIGPNPDR